MGGVNCNPGRRFPASITLILVLAMAGCQSVPQPPSQPRSEQAAGGERTVDPDYSRHIRRITQALGELPSGSVPANADAFGLRAIQLRAVGDDFLVLAQSGPATGQEYPLWGDYFNRLADTAEAVVSGDADLGEAEKLYELAARLYPVFLERSNLPERPLIAVDGETSAYYAGNYFLCTMPELIADGYGRRRNGRMDDHLSRAMERYLGGPCEPDLMFSAAEMLYDYALVSGADQDAYLDRIEQAGPGKSTPWLMLLDNLSLADNRGQALANLDRAQARARADLDDGDEISVEFVGEVERQRAVLIRESGALQALPYRP
ncbi:hypothetical protein [Marinobacter sp. F4206]|uniref:hypothetical protein n=1 Tax=Marinobacter sp. F4206 TaxID=2861777 RepID=UPI001C5CF4D3|nr:hypothetical protein [Marinobacter sp. F4206]MBW4935990.1 hypothetical protein [Marinobacter sp. F4206]